MVLAVYRQTASLPDSERFGLISQMRRAAVSVPANIAEGFKRRGAGDKTRFYNFAQGSAEEVRYYFILCQDLGYLSDTGALREQADHIGRMLSRLIRRVEQSTL